MNKVLALSSILFLISCGDDNSQTQPGSTGGIDTLRGDAYKFYSAFLAAGVPTKPLEDALAFYEDNQEIIKNKSYITIADYSQSSIKNRFYLLNMDNGQVNSIQVSHGSGAVREGLQVVKYGDPDHDGFLDRCRHYSSSAAHPYLNMTRAGFMLTAHTYRSSKDFPNIGYKNHNAMKLIGLEDRNEDALRNGVVMHEATYNTRGSIMGRSWGCPAFVPGEGGPIINKIKDGSLYYSYAPQCD
jgi:hypothetical protein